MSQLDPQRDESIDALFEEFVAQWQFGESPDAEAFLAAHPDHADALRARFASLAVESTVRGSQTQPPLLPRRIGFYTVLDVLGEGGMGTVYLGEQREPVRRRVALKVIKLGMDSRAVLARFEAERQALAMMEHSCIARVLDVGVTEAGQPYFAMEYVKGVPITDYCDQNRCSLRERIELFRQVCAGVQHAHLKGVMHRDLKPSNILVTLQDGRPLPKIIDFGLAKAMDHLLVEATLFTQQGQIVGTPEYMSPEQADRGGLDVDTRTDVYSLGVLLYEVLTGVLPFSRRALLDAGLLEMQRVIREQEPARPSSRIATLGATASSVAQRRGTSERELQQRLRGDLDWIVMRALEKDRTRRYDTALELAADLERHLRNEPVLASPPSVGYRLRKLLRRYRGPVVAGLLLAITLTVGAVTAIVFAVRAARNAADAAEARGLADQRAAAAAAAQHAAEQAAATATAERQRALRLAYLAGLQATQSALASGDRRAAVARLLACPAAERGFEWRRTHLQLDASVHVLVGHVPPVTALEWSSDGRGLASFGPNEQSNEAWRLWRSDTGAQSGAAAALPRGWWRRGTVRPYVAANTLEVETSDGRTVHLPFRRGSLVTAGQEPNTVVDVQIDQSGSEATVVVWDFEAGQALRRRALPVDACMQPAISPDGAYVVVCQEPHRPTFLWLADDMLCVGQGRQRGAIQKWTSSQDGARLASTDGAEIVVWDTHDGRALCTLPLAEPVAAWAFDPKGEHLAVAEATDIRVWDVARRVCGQLRGHQNNLAVLAYCPDGKLLASADFDGAVRVWDAAAAGTDGRTTETLDDTSMLLGDGGLAGCSPAGSVAFSIDGAELQVLRLDGGVQQSVSFGQPPVVRRTSVFAAGSDGKVIACALHRWLDPARHLVVVDTDKGAVRRIADVPAEGSATIALSADGRCLAVVLIGAVRVFDLQRGTSVDVPTSSSAECVALAADGRRLAAAFNSGMAGVVRVWRLDAVQQPELELPQVGIDAGVSALCFSPAAELLAVGTFGPDVGGVRLWELARRRQSFAAVAHRAAVRCLCFSGDGRVLLSGGEDCRVRAWDVASGDQLLDLAGHRSSITCVGFDATNERVLSCDAAGNARVWPSTVQDLVALRQRFRGH